MPLIAAVEMLAQLFFAVHAVKNGKDRYWIFIIIFFPGIGCLIYFFSEYLPDYQYQSRLRKKRNTYSSPQKQLKHLLREVEITPSVKNRKALAQCYVNLGEFDKAIDIYQGCLEGIHAGDPFIIEGLSLAYFFQSDYLNAKKHLLHLMEIRGERRGDDFDLILARSYEALGELEDAEKVYSKLHKVYSGEEARCRYGLLLKRLGQKEKAREIFNSVLKRERLSQKFYVKSQRKWFDLAGKEARGIRRG